MSARIIRFPTAAKLGEPMPLPNATPLSWYTRLHRWIVGYQRKRTANSWRFENVRRGR